MKWRLLAWGLAGVLLFPVFLGAESSYQPENRFKEKLAAWAGTQSWSGEGSFSMVAFEEEAFTDFYDKDALPLVRFGSGWYPLPNLSSTILVGGMYEAEETVGLITGERSGSEVKLYVLPVQWDLRYRFKFVDNQAVVPSVWGGLDYWWFAEEAEDGDDLEGDKTGWHWGADIGFLLDLADPQAARQMNKYWGVDDTYLCLGYEALAVGEDEDGLRFSGEIYSVTLRFDIAGQ